MIDAANLAIYLGVGAVSGFLSGLIGIGGAFVLVPALHAVFVANGIAAGHELSTVVGTTMLCILFTSIRTTRSQLRKDAVRIDVVKRFVPWVTLGVVVGSVVAASIETTYVKYAFAAFCIYCAVQLFFFADHEHPDNKNLATSNLRIPGVVFGSISGLIGVGGATFFVPYLVNRSVDVRHAMATSSALQVPMAFVGTCTYVLLGRLQDPSSGITGYVYIPAAIGVLVASMLSAPIGVKLSHTLTRRTLKNSFGTVATVSGAKTLGIATLGKSLVITALAMIGIDF